MATHLFGSEFLPALKTLSSPIEALLPAAILVILLISPAVQGHVLGAHIYLGDRVLLGLIAAWGGRLLNAGNSDPIRQACATITSLVTGTEYVPAFKTLSKLVGIYFKATFSTALACYALHISNSSTPYLLYVFVFALAAALVFGLVAPTKAFYGPLRWGYLQYSDFFFRTYEILLNWWLCAALLSFLSPFLSSFLFPFLGFSILGAAIAAWFKVYQEYHKKLQDVISQSSAEASRATIAADHACKYANSACQYEKQMLKVLAVTRRDVLLADSVKLTDFFDVAAKSWTAMERVTNPFGEVTKKAEEIVDAAYEVEELEKPVKGGKNERFDEDDEDEEEMASDEEAEMDDEDGDDGGLSELAADLVEKAKDAVRTVKKVDSKLKVARRAVLTSRAAKDQTAKARSMVLTNAEDATTTAKKLLSEVAGALDSCFGAAQNAENAKRDAEKAVAAATMGEMGNASTFVASARKAAIDVVTTKDALKVTRNNAREYLVEALRTLSKQARL